jgi:DNA helicase-4
MMPNPTTWGALCWGEGVEIGAKVTHKHLGIGVLTFLYSGGLCCDVRFASKTLREVKIADFSFVDPRVIAEQQREFRRQIMQSVRAGDFAKADQLYERSCSAWWSRGDYDAARQAAETALLEAKRRRLMAGVVQLLEQGEFDSADRRYSEQCTEWWELPDYQRHRSRAHALHTTVSRYASCSLAQLDAWLSEGDTRVGVAEVAVLKQPKLDVRLARYGIHLDREQRLACARPDRRLLISARAGSGKTRTLAALAALAMDDEGLDPDQVLILAFNSKAAEEIRNRVKATAGITDYRNARTFHSLAYRLAGATGRKLIFDNGRGDPSTRAQSRFVERTIRNILNPAFKEDLYAFFRRELEQIERIGSDLPKAEYFAFRRAMSQVSLGGESVKSNGEKFIADFLFEHGIKYVYEKPWSWARQDRIDGSSYHPDFCISAGGRDVILEHWAIDPEDPQEEVPTWWKDTDTERYRSQIVEKRRFWSERGITLLETHTGMLRPGRSAFEAQLGRILASVGLRCEKLGEAELVRRVAEAPNTISRMAGLFLAFIQRAKKRDWSVQETEAAIARDPDLEPRNRMFHQLALRAFGEYERLLQAESAMDFDDLMVIATERVRKDGAAATIGLDEKSVIALKDLRWLLLDEFQDFSELYYRLIDAILTVNPRLRMVAVGDDWQAINGFAGAQLEFFENFAKFFPGGGTAGIATNYRSAPAIVGAGNRVMAGRGRPAMASKTGEAEMAVESIDKRFVEFRAGVEYEADRKRDSIYFVGTPFASGELQSKGPSIPQQQAARALKACVEFILASAWRDGANKLWLGKVLVLARTGYAYGLELKEFGGNLRWILEHHEGLARLSNDIELEVMTAHKAKGREADTVILLDVTSRQFPKIHADNALYQPFGVTMADTLAEERRLFYVAITRAEWRLLLLTETGQESPYIEGLQLDRGRGSSERLVTSSGSAQAGAPSLSDTGKAIQSRVEAINRWDLIIGNASPSALPILRRLRAQRYPAPEVGHSIQGESGELCAELAWPNQNPPSVILTGAHAVQADQWRNAGWCVLSP